MGLWEGNLLDDHIVLAMSEVNEVTEESENLLSADGHDPRRPSNPSQSVENFTDRLTPEQQPADGEYKGPLVMSDQLRFPGLGQRLRQDLTDEPSNRANGSNTAITPAAVGDCKRCNGKAAPLRP